MAGAGEGRHGWAYYLDVDPEVLDARLRYVPWVSLASF